MEIRSDGTRTVARGALKDELSGEQVSLVAKGNFPLELAAQLTRALVTAPLTAGQLAKAMLQKDEGILSLRGRWHEWRSADGKLELPALPTLHPAFLLRQPGAKKRAWADLLTLTERLDRPDRPA